GRHRSGPLLTRMVVDRRRCRACDRCHARSGGECPRTRGCAHVRTFVALNLPADERVRLHDALEPLRSKALPIRWVPPESLHVTVKFLGDTESDGIDAIRRVL